MQFTNVKHLLPQKYYLQCELTLEGFRLILPDSDVNDKRDQDNVQRKSGLTRCLIKGYLRALADADIITEYQMMQAMEQYSTAITAMYELWLDEVQF